MQYESRGVIAKARINLRFLSKIWTLRATETPPSSISLILHTFAFCWSPYTLIDRITRKEGSTLSHVTYQSPNFFKKLLIRGNEKANDRTYLLCRQEDKYPASSGIKRRAVWNTSKQWISVIYSVKNTNNIGYMSYSACFSTHCKMGHFKLIILQLLLQHNRLRRVCKDCSGTPFIEC